MEPHLRLLHTVHGVVLNYEQGQLYYRLYSIFNDAPSGSDYTASNSEYNIR
jgi:hypothetical protein